MRIVIADDNRDSLDMLGVVLRHYGHEVIACPDGQSAWEVLSEPTAPQLAILDWVMPRLAGPEVCHRVRSLARPQPTYLILLTGRLGKGDVVAGLESGADDYIVKPYDTEELLSRIHVGERILGLQNNLAERVQQLEEALSQVKLLKGLLPICCYCKKIRDDHNYWQRLEAYFSRHADVQFSHGICPDCYDNVVKRNWIASPERLQQRENHPRPESTR